MTDDNTSMLRKMELILTAASVLSLFGSVASGATGKKFFMFLLFALFAIYGLMAVLSESIGNVLGWDDGEKSM